MPNRSPCEACGKPGVVARGLCRSCYYGRKNRGEPLPPKISFSFGEYLEQIVPDANGCWPWPGFINLGGYGTTGKHTPAHVASYEHHIGPVPEKHDVGHVCHDKDVDCQDWRVCTHRRCINPDHLVAQTRSENLRARPWRQDECKRGHDLNGPHVRIIPQTGARQCLLCVEVVKAERAAGIPPTQKRRRAS